MDNLEDAEHRLQIVEPLDNSNNGVISIEGVKSYGPTFFEPQGEMNDTPKSGRADNSATAGGALLHQSTSEGGGEEAPPEKKLTLLALRLAVLEKAASGLGALGFIWATVVLLGGFAIALEKKDFWSITVILLIEGARIFSRSRELEWQHQATWSLADVSRSKFRAFKSTSQILLQSGTFILRPFSIRGAQIPTKIVISRARSSKESDMQQPRSRHAGSWVFLSRNVSKALYWLQLLAATACISLSILRLSEQDFGQLQPDDPDKKNRNAALNIFYGLALAEAFLFLVEKAYWEWKVSYRMLLEEVNRECRLGASGMVSVKRFFYDAYSKCVEGSIFDVLKMDFVAFAVELLASGSRDEQLIGARILLKFSTSGRFADNTLRKLGTLTAVIERLIDMLNWKNPAEEEIRRSAAMIVSKLAGKKQNALRVAGIPGAMESISSLLYTGHRRNLTVKPDEISSHCSDISGAGEFTMSNILGLLILKKLANDHDNCGKMGNTRGLLAKIIDFTAGGERLDGQAPVTELQIKAIKRSMQVVKMLTNTTGHTGKVLRREISEIVFTISNIREILQHGGRFLRLQKLGIEILTSLAMDEGARERIGRTGGMLEELLRIFFSHGCSEVLNAVRVEAGEALAMLALENKSNCSGILKDIGAVKRLVGALDDPVLRVNSSRTLLNLCKYSGDEHLFRLAGVTAGITTVLKAIMVEERKLLEVSLGLATQILRFMSTRDLQIELTSLGINEVDLAKKLQQILERYCYPNIKVPRMRRFVVELTIKLMEYDAKYSELFGDAGMKQQLLWISTTTSELECFNVFSGSVGLSPHGASLGFLVDAALQLMMASS